MVYSTAHLATSSQSAWEISSSRSGKLFTPLSNDFKKAKVALLVVTIFSTAMRCFKPSSFPSWAAVFLILLPVGVTYASFNYSGDQTSKESRYEQRQSYKQLLTYLESRQFTRFQSEKQSLRDYPLYPYLEYRYLIRRLSRQSQADIDEFTTQYVDTPLANQLKQNWLYSLGKRGQWRDYLAAYSPDDNNSKENQCFYPYALHRNGETQAALKAAKALWLVPFSQPDECDPSFKLWRDAGGLTPDVAWQRYESAIKANEITLANYLERYLDRADRGDAAKLKRLHTRPRRLAQENLNGLNTERGRSTFDNSLYRLIRRDAKMALDVLTRESGLLIENPERRTGFYTDIAVRLVRNDEDWKMLDNFPIDLTADQSLIETRLLRYVRENNWAMALAMHNLLDQDRQSSLRWRYWRARILEENGTLAGSSEANEIFNALATERSFYGFLAADRQGLEYNFEDAPEAITHEQVHALEETPGIQRALELFTLNESTRARREWNFTIRQFSDIELRIAARVAEKWGWHEQAIRAMITAKAWDDLNPRFPLAYRDNFVAGSRSEDIPVTWSLAIARQESAFMVDARSSAGALGLMQLMPGTAQQVARQTNRRLSSNNDLTNPFLNIELGTAYLGRMFRRFSHNRILASAAYNAGPSRVERWQNPELPVDVWIETIPFSETRNYVQNVLMFSTIYSRKLGQQSPMIYQHELLDFAPIRDNAVSSTQSEQNALANASRADHPSSGQLH